ncbi:hypothetical protein BLTE_10900 [Blastochloris tepida]|uniref:Uncharacterized protein n=1 Tax=Blastochloris tepida TaxID=2233851 RepID=A0A348FYM2_9HYPH|nr:hypothetical protein BLTE_10900 [Blastochloris tepida]
MKRFSGPIGRAAHHNRGLVTTGVLAIPCDPPAGFRIRPVSIRNAGTLGAGFTDLQSVLSRCSVDCAAPTLWRAAAARAGHCRQAHFAVAADADATCCGAVTLSRLPQFSIRKNTHNNRYSKFSVAVATARLIPISI